MNNIGFVILSHRSPTQLKRLTNALNDSYGPIAIICHHDFRSCELNPDDYSSSVTFVRPNLPTSWGGISIVLAELAALNVLYSEADPEWVVILSGSDYPVRHPDLVMNELASTSWDAFLDYHRIGAESGCESITGSVSAYDHPEWIALARERYLGGGIRNTGRSVFFTTTRRCFAGDHWLTANRRAARALLEAVQTDSSILEYFRNCLVPDEAVYQTILCNDSSLQICPDNRRYSDWSAGGLHPKNLEIDDLSAVFRSEAYFARKFAPESSALDYLDQALCRRPS
jgi:hypothetical protein